MMIGNAAHEHENKEVLMDLITPEWPAPARVRAAQTTRHGGVSIGQYCCLNLAQHVGDDAAAVSKNRALLRDQLSLPSEPLWLEQVHGTQVVVANQVICGNDAPRADSCLSTQRGEVAVVMTADCLPVLLCDTAGTCVAVAHAGWRGLAAGVIERTVAAMPAPPHKLLAWLGPAIGVDAFEVGDEVRTQFVHHDMAAVTAFHPNANGHWQCDLMLLARQRLAVLGVSGVFGGGWCTYSDAPRFFSYRRDGVTGRMATMIWLE